MVYYPFRNITQFSIGIKKIDTRGEDTKKLKSTLFYPTLRGYHVFSLTENLYQYFFNNRPRWRTLIFRYSF
jgi:hypothetical protein